MLINSRVLVLLLVLISLSRLRDFLLLAGRHLGFEEFHIFCILLHLLVHCLLSQQFLTQYLLIWSSFSWFRDFPIIARPPSWFSRITHSCISLYLATHSLLSHQLSNQYLFI